jgi:hypothetical protein
MPHFFDKLPRLGYASDLHKHLKGLDPNSFCESYTGTDIYTWISIWMMGVSLILIINFYYGLLNRPKCSKFIYWLLNILATGTIIFGLAYTRVNDDLNNHNYCEELSFGATDCMLFGMTAAVYAIILSIIISFIIKWGSLHNKKIPV